MSWVLLHSRDRHVVLPGAGALVITVKKRNGVIFLQVTRALAIVVVAISNRPRAVSLLPPLAEGVTPREGSRGFAKTGRACLPRSWRGEPWTSISDLKVSWTITLLSRAVAVLLSLSLSRWDARWMAPTSPPQARGGGWWLHAWRGRPTIGGACRYRCCFAAGGGAP